MRNRLHTCLILLVMTTPAYSAGKPLVLKTVDSFGFKYPGRIRISGLSSDGTAINLVNQLITPNLELIRICENSARQMMLKPGKWQLELSTPNGSAPSSPDAYIVNCDLTPAQ